MKTLIESSYLQERLSELKDDEEPDAKGINCQRINDGERLKKELKKGEHYLESYV